jgi:hypothetical protein
MRRKNHSEPTVNIEFVLKDRLKLQTNQKLLTQKFNITPDFISITRPNFLLNYKTWPVEKKNEFINLIGGPVNYTRTSYFLNNLIEKVENHKQ